jgi:hypothetical protein
MRAFDKIKIICETKQSAGGENADRSRMNSALARLRRVRSPSSGVLEYSIPSLYAVSLRCSEFMDALCDHCDGELYVHVTNYCLDKLMAL